MTTHYRRIYETLIVATFDHDDPVLLLSSVDSGFHAGKSCLMRAQQFFSITDIYVPILVWCIRSCTRDNLITVFHTDDDDDDHCTCQTINQVSIQRPTNPLPKRYHSHHKRRRCAIINRHIIWLARLTDLKCRHPVRLIQLSVFVVCEPRSFVRKSAAVTSENIIYISYLPWTKDVA